MTRSFSFHFFEKHVADCIFAFLPPHPMYSVMFAACPSIHLTVHLLPAPPRISTNAYTTHSTSVSWSGVVFICCAFIPDNGHVIVNPGAFLWTSAALPAVKKNHAPDIDKPFIPYRQYVALWVWSRVYLHPNMLHSMCHGRFGGTFLRLLPFHCIKFAAILFSVTTLFKPPPVGQRVVNQIMLFASDNLDFSPGHCGYRCLIA